MGRVATSPVSFGNNGAMALNVNRWLQYAKARIDSAVGSGHAELDRLEAQQEAERADKPWLASDSAAPTFDEARARIAWEADQQAKKVAEREREQQDERMGSDIDRSPGDRAPGRASDDAAPTAADPRRGDGDPNAPDAAHSRNDAHGGTATDGRTAADPDGATTAAGPTSADPPPSDPTPVDTDPASGQPIDAGPAPRSPQQIADDAELETARLELEDRQRQSVERLAQIRQELGIEDPPAP